jgi:hypothetical protein
LQPERVPHGVGHLPLARQAWGERVTAAGSGRLPGQGAVVSLMHGARLMAGAYLNGGEDMG